ncbi:MAG: arsenate reductase ArsC [Planctomycetaceae bacterium]
MLSRGPMMEKKQRVLFLCTGNSCRSQMAEGLLRELAGDRIEALSAGANPAGYVHEKAIQVMQELGIDISHQRSKHIREFLPPDGDVPDIIIGVCSTADENCPVFPANVERWQWPFDDPHYAVGDDARKLSEFRRVRDEIHERLKQQFLNP